MDGTVVFRDTGEPVGRKIMTDKDCRITKPAKTKHKNDQKYVWRWYVDDGDGWVGPHRSKREAVEYARSLLMRSDGTDDYVEIAMGKTSVADLSEAIDDAFAEEMLRSLMMDADIYGKYETPFEIEAEIAGVCTDAKRHDLVRRLKTAVAAWQSEHRIAVPVGDITDFKNNYFVHPLPKNADKAEAAE